MTTKASGGRITGLLALTVESSVALVVGDPAHVTGTYTVAKADGSKPVLGHVSVANVKRAAGTGAYPVSNVPGDVTVEARGFEVRTVTSGAAFGAGVEVGVGADSKYYAAGANVATTGISLQAAGAANAAVDVLIR